VKYKYILLFALVIAVLRVLGMHNAAYQAVAHLFVGGLAGAWYVGRDKLILTIAILLSVVELACAIFLR